jgi:hypothetical protein
MELTASASPRTSLRHRADLAALFASWEGRHLTDAEFGHFLALCPDHATRIEAAREMRLHDSPVVRTVVTELLELYPLARHHPDALAKTIRDVRFTCAYVTLAMLAGDPAWLRDRLLLWLKAVLQAFEFPDLAPNAPHRLCREPAVVAVTERLRPGQRAIHDCYNRLWADLRARLSPAATAELEPYFRLTIDVLSQD